MENSRRKIVKIIQEICSENEISYESFSYDWMFRLSKHGKVAHIVGYQFEKNSATSHLICSDKCSVSQLLHLNQIPSVDHHLFMSPQNLKYVGGTGNWSGLCELLARHGKLVCKSNDGTGGNDVYLVANQFELEIAAHKIYSRSKAMAVCPFYEIAREFRVIILDGAVKLIYQKNLPYVLGDGRATLRQLLVTSLQEDGDRCLSLNIPEADYAKILAPSQKYYLHWKHNLGQGAKPEIILDQALIEPLALLALHAAAVVQIQFASVDIIETGQHYLILEINSGVMMEHFSRLNDNHYHIAKQIYQAAIESMLS